MTRKFALPKLRIARIRPAVRGLRPCSASSASPVFCAVRLDQRRDRVGALERVRVRSHAEALELLEVRAPLAQLVGFLLLVWSAVLQSSSCSLYTDRRLTHEDHEDHEDTTQEF